MTDKSQSQDGQPQTDGLPQVGRKQGSSRFLWVVGLALLVMVGLALSVQLVWQRMLASRAGSEKKIEQVAAKSLPDLTRGAFDRLQEQKAPPPLPEQSKTAPLPTDKGPTQDEKAAAEFAARRRRSDILSSVSGGGSGIPADAGGGTGSLFGESGMNPMKSSTLSDAMVATRMRGSRASVLANSDMMVTQGQFFDCVLQTALNSQLPGMVGCIVTRDVYSTNGHVLLVDRGSRVVGQYQSAQLRQGMDRIFVLWTRVETPEGVIITLDSPATDEVGRSGMSGAVDNHFFARFGAAMLISLVDDVAQNLSQNQNNNGNSFTYQNSVGGAQSAVSTVLQSTMNIPPTLDRAQGGHVNIFVARDLDFGSVYELGMRKVSSIEPPR